VVECDALIVSGMCRWFCLWCRENRANNVYYAAA